jgi:hypothetical protein
MSISTKVSQEQIKDALSRSGYLLESRIEATLRSRYYYVETNTPYPDPDTGKSRELDVYATSAYKAGPEEFDFIFSVLLVECVNNPQPVAFITKEPQDGFPQYQEVKLAGLPVKILKEGRGQSWESLPSFLGLGKYHHYFRGRVATQFCSFTLKKNTAEWMASHEDLHFDAFRTLCTAVEHFIDKHFKCWTFNGREMVNVEFYHPVVVFQGELLDVRLRKKSLRLLPTNHIQFRRSAIVHGKETEYRVDVVTERFFSRYLDIVQQESIKSARLLRRRHRFARRAIDKITRTARRLRSPEKLRGVMDL